MMEKLTLKTQITFKAPIDKVWMGLTEPAIVKEYFFGTDLSSDWKVGGHITFRGVWDGHSYEDGGTILELERPRLLKYSYWSSMSGTENIPDNYNHISYELREESGLTFLVITQEGIKSQDAIAQSEQNWTAVFDGLKKIIE